MSALLSAAFFGVGSALAKLLLEDMHPLGVASLAYLLSGVLLLSLRASSWSHLGALYRFFGLPQLPFPSVRKSDFLMLVPMALFGAVLAPIAFMTGLSMTTASSASILSVSENAFTVLLAAALLDERLRPGELPPLVATLTGVAVLSWAGAGDSGVGDPLGNALVVMACLLWSVDNLISRILSVRGDPLEIAGLKSLLGGGTLTALAPVIGVEIKLEPSHVLLLAALGFVSVGSSLVLYVAALHHIGAGRTSVIFASSALFGVVFAIILLGESLSFQQQLACLLIIPGVIGLYAAGRAQQRGSEANSYRDLIRSDLVLLEKFTELSSGRKGDLAALALGFGSAALGLALAKLHPILFPAVMTAAIYPLYLADLRASKNWRAARHVLLWAFSSTVAMIALTVLLGEQIGSLVLHGESYRYEMFEWIKTGAGPEGDPRLFVAPKLREIAVFSALSLISAGLLGLFLGSFLLNYMNYYVGCLIVHAQPGKLWVPLIFGWPIYAIIRVVGYVNLGVVLSIPLLRLLKLTDLSLRDARKQLALALACIALDFALKATVANAVYWPMLSQAVRVP